MVSKQAYVHQGASGRSFNVQIKRPEGELLERTYDYVIASRSLRCKAVLKKEMVWDWYEDDELKKQREEVSRVEEKVRQRRQKERPCSLESSCLADYDGSK